MKRLILVLAVAVPYGSVVSATTQTADSLAIQIEGKVILINGGERASVSGSSGEMTIGQSTKHAFSLMPNMCGFSVSGRVEPGAVNGWVVEATPTKVEAGAVSFHLRWERADSGQGPTAVPREIDLTLRSGQSLPLDLVPLSPTVKMPYERCGIRAATIRVSVVAWPPAQDDRRLIATDLWLVQRLPNGTERSEAMTVRGLPGHAMPFYFESISGGGSSLDFYGELTPLLKDGGVEMKLTTRSRLTEGGRSTTTMRVEGRGNMMMARQVQSTIRLGANDVVSVELPRLSESDTGAFGNHTFSIRVRSRQMR